MADQYIEAPIEFDEYALYNTGIARIQEYFPSWTPKENGFIDLLLRGVASMIAVDAEVASTVPYSIFRAFGPLAHDLAIDATPATVESIWTVIDAQGGYPIPAGTPVGMVQSGTPMEPVGFETVDDAVVAAGEQTVSITLVATVAGANSSGLDTTIRADSLTYVTSVTVSGVTQGGNDGELDEDYVNRLSSDFEDWTTTPIRGPDFARKARDVAGVYRCAYWENYDPVGNTTDNDKYVALCPIDIDGNAVSAQTQQNVADYIESLREVNFVCPVVAPAYSQIAVSAQLHVSDPANQASAIADAQTVLAEFLNPALWGSGGTTPYPVWSNSQIIRLSKVVTELEGVTNVSYADEVEIGLEGQALGTTDLTMSGDFPLPQPGTFTITAVTP
jgi:hypothetical protein